MATSSDVLDALKALRAELCAKISEQALSYHQDLQRFMATVDTHFEDLCSQLIRPSGIANQPSRPHFSPWIPPFNLQPLPNLSIPRAKSSILLTNPIYPSSPSPPPLSTQKTIDPSSPRTLPFPISPDLANPIPTTAAPTHTIISSVHPISKPPNQFPSLSISSDPHYPLPAQQTETTTPPKTSPIVPLSPHQYQSPHQLSLTPIVLPSIPSPDRFPLSKPLPDPHPSHQTHNPSDPPSPDPPPDECDQDLTEPLALSGTTSNGGGNVEKPEAVVLSYHHPDPNVKGEVTPGQPPDPKPDPNPNKAKSAPEREAQFGAQPERTKPRRTASEIRSHYLIFPPKIQRLIASAFEDFLWQGSAIVISKILLPQIFENMEMQRIETDVVISYIQHSGCMRMKKIDYAGEVFDEMPQKR